MTDFCQFDRTGPDLGVHTYTFTCPACRIVRTSKAATYVRICPRPLYVHPTEQARRRKICQSCKKFISDSERMGACGCKNLPKCSRWERWESLVRAGSCPEGKWEPLGS